MRDPYSLNQLTAQSEKISQVIGISLWIALVCGNYWLTPLFPEPRKGFSEFLFYVAFSVIGFAALFFLWLPNFSFWLALSKAKHECRIYGHSFDDSAKCQKDKHGRFCCRCLNKVE
jgi:hypothetical protein